MCTISVLHITYNNKLAPVALSAITPAPSMGGSELQVLTLLISMAY